MYSTFVAATKILCSVANDTSISLQSFSLTCPDLLTADEFTKHLTVIATVTLEIHTGRYKEHEQAISAQIHVRNDGIVSPAVCKHRAQPSHRQWTPEANLENPRLVQPEPNNSTSATSEIAKQYLRMNPATCGKRVCGTFGRAPDLVCTVHIAAAEANKYFTSSISARFLAVAQKIKG